MDVIFPASPMLLYTQVRTLLVCIVVTGTNMCMCGVLGPCVCVYGVYGVLWLGLPKSPVLYTNTPRLPFISPFTTYTPPYPHTHAHTYPYCQYPPSLYTLTYPYRLYPPYIHPTYTLTVTTVQPDLLRLLLIPVLAYAHNDTFIKFSNPFSPHQLGTYPIANDTTARQVEDGPRNT